MTRQLTPEQQRRRQTPCIDCASPCWAKRCRPCYDLHVGADPQAAVKRKRERAIRQRRDLAAPGLTIQQRRNLRLKWLKQGRRCAYCDAMATQVDHVVPLALGGTNYEGNLTPCCASCNVRKSDSLLIEWKWKVRVKRERVEPPPLPVRTVRQTDYTKRVCKVYFGTCDECAAPFASRNAKSHQCIAHRGWPSIEARLRPCADCGVEVQYVTRPVDRCPSCASMFKQERTRIARREHRRTHGKGKCEVCGQPRWGARWCQRCYQSFFVQVGGVDQPLPLFVA